MSPEPPISHWFPISAALQTLKRDRAAPQTGDAAARPADPAPQADPPAVPPAPPAEDDVP
jgi:hypothetical protein